MLSQPPPCLSIQFVIIGGSITGMTAAVGLARAGHQVTVLDSDPDFFKSPMGGGCRVAPNSSGVFYRWGMEDALRAASVKSTGVLFAQWDNGSLIGAHEWEESVMEELGGDFLLISYGELRRILAECAVKHGAVLRPSCLVVGVTPDAERPSVALASGEVVTADVVVGADGNLLQRIARRVVLEGIGEEDVEKPGDWQVYNAVIPTSALQKLNDPAILQLSEPGKVYTWFSKSYGALGFPVPQGQSSEPLFTLFVYVGRGSSDHTPVRLVPKEELLQWVQGGDPRIAALAAASTRILSSPMTQQPFLKEWVHRKGNVICIGQSAHPIHPGSIYPLSLSVGDAAALGQIFSHLHRREQIKGFLHAVQEVREPRVKAVLEVSVGNIFAGDLPPGVAEHRDSGLHERAEEEVRNLGTEGPQNTSEKMVSVIEDVFAYDPEDAAENWWQRWGITQERAERIFVQETFSMTMGD
ncbi:FAD/NAD(P)-binding domain-containing protein [Ganoderma leucocontextum]|nr:FAD/NAD(P)-binding domain-containing protein [Ganoderma leucocontextum]